jgi:hypothetical protein
VDKHLVPPTGGPTHRYFRKYAAHWAAAIGAPAATDEDFEVLWDRLEECPSFESKLSNPKMMRWFSINGCVNEQMSDFWVLKMVLRYSQSGVDTVDDDMHYQDPALSARRNPVAELRQLRSQTGGWQLAEKLLTPWLHSHVHVYWWGTKAVWSFYTEQCRKGNSPVAQLARYNSWSAGGWASEIKDEPHNRSSFCIRELPGNSNV